MGAGSSLAAARGGGQKNANLEKLDGKRRAVRYGDEVEALVTGLQGEVGSLAAEQEQEWFGKKEERKALSAEQHRLMLLKKRKKEAREKRLAKRHAEELEAQFKEGDVGPLLDERLEVGQRIEAELAAEGKTALWRMKIARARMNVAMYVMVSKAVARDRWDDASQFMTGVPAMIDAVLGHHVDRDKFIFAWTNLMQVEADIRQRENEELEAIHAELRMLEEEKAAFMAALETAAKEADSERKHKGAAKVRRQPSRNTRAARQVSMSHKVGKILDDQTAAARRELAIEGEMRKMEELFAKMGDDLDARHLGVAGSDAVAEAFGKVMYSLNNSNTRHLSAYKYDLPHVFSMASHTTHEESEGIKAYGFPAGFTPPHLAMGIFKAKELVVEYLKEGKIAFQFLAANDGVHFNGKRCDLWTQDPWEIIDHCIHEGAAADEEHDVSLGVFVKKAHIEGIPFGPRLLFQLLVAVEEVAGPESLHKLAIVIHVTDQMEQTVCGDLSDREFYGLLPQNVLIVKEPRNLGYNFDRESNAFVEDPQSQPALLGSGVSMKMLEWRSKAYVLDARAYGTSGNKVHRYEKKYLVGDVVQYLHGEGYEWLLSYRPTDLARYSSKTALDLEAMAWTIKLHHDVGARMSVESVDLECTADHAWTRASQNGIVVHKSSHQSKDNDSEDLMSAGLRKHAASLEGFDAAYVGIQRSRDTESIHDEDRCRGPFVASLKAASLHSLEARELVEAVAAAKKSVCVELPRHMFHVDSMTEVLDGARSTAPDIKMHQGRIYGHLDVRDVTFSEESRCVAVRGIGSGPEMVIPEGDLLALDRDMVLNLAHTFEAQDNDQRFRTKTNEYVRSAAPATLIGVEESSVSQTVVLVVDTDQRDACERALDYITTFIAAGRDELHIVATIQEGAHSAFASRTLSSLHVADSYIKVRKEVLHRWGQDSEGDALAMYCHRVDATLVVVPSLGASARGEMSARLRYRALMNSLYAHPVLVLKSDTRLTPWSTDVLVRCSGVAKEAVSFLGTLLRQSKDVIHCLTQNFENETRQRLEERILENISSAGAEEGFKVNARWAHYVGSKTLQASAFHRELQFLDNADSPTPNTVIACVVAPATHKITEEIVKEIDGCTGHVLLWRRHSYSD